MDTKKTSVQGRATLYRISTWNHHRYGYCIETQMKTGSPQKEERREEGRGRGGRGFRRYPLGQIHCSAKGRRTQGNSLGPWGRVEKAGGTTVNSTASQKLGMEETLPFNLLKIWWGKQIQLLSANPSWSLGAEHSFQGLNSRADRLVTVNYR